MDLNERIGWMLLGAVIGLFAGYLIRYLQEMKEELDEMDGLVKRKLSDRSDDGFMSNRVIADVMMLVVLVIVVAAAFMSQKASNDVADTQAHDKRVVGCVQEYLTQTITALNERTEFQAQALQSNVELQKDQEAFFALLLRKPPESVAVRTDAAQNYLKSLGNFVDISEKNRVKIAGNPYPTKHQLQSCLNND